MVDTARPNAPVIHADGTEHRRQIATVVNLINQSTPDYRRTAAEIAAGVTVVDYRYPEGNVKRYGVTGDGTTADTAAIIVAKSVGIPLFWPKGQYVFDNGTTALSSSTDDLTWIGEGRDETVFLCRNLVYLETPSAGTLTLSSNISRGDSTLTLSDTSDISRHDIIKLTTTVIAETDRNRTRQQAFTVVSVDSSTQVTVAERANFNITTADAGLALTLYATPRKVVIKGMTFRSIDASNPNRGLQLIGTRQSVLSDVAFEVDDEDADVDTAPDGLLIDSCVDTQLSNVAVRRCRYGLLVQRCNRTHVRGITSERCRHPVSPHFFSDGLYVSDLSGENNKSILDAHESFEVHYTRVETNSDIDVSNIRSCGGSLTHSRIISHTTSGATQMQNINFVSADLELYDEHDFHVKEVVWHAPEGFTVSRGRLVTLDNLYLSNDRRLNLSDVTGGDSITQAVIRNVNYDNSTNGSIRCKVNYNTAGMATFGYQDAELVSSVYHIRQPNGLFGDERISLKGKIYTNTTSADTDPKEVSIRIYTDPKPYDASITQMVFGVLKLTGLVSHSNAGLFDIKEETFHFRHKKTATTAVEFPTTSAQSSGATGQANESLTVTVDNVSQAAVSATDGREHYVQFDVNLTSSRTSPKYSLYYELELFGALQ